MFQDALQLQVKQQDEPEAQLTIAPISSLIVFLVQYQGALQLQVQQQDAPELQLAIAPTDLSPAALINDVYATIPPQPEVRRQFICPLAQ